MRCIRLLGDAWVAFGWWCLHVWPAYLQNLSYLMKLCLAQLLCVRIVENVVSLVLHEVEGIGWRNICACMGLRSRPFARYWYVLYVREGLRSRPRCWLLDAELYERRSRSSPLNTIRESCIVLTCACSAYAWNTWPMHGREEWGMRGRSWPRIGHKNTHSLIFG